MADEMKHIYFDEDEHVQFNDTFLEEIDKINKVATDEDSPTLLEKLIENTQKSQEKSLGKRTTDLI